MISSTNTYCAFKFKLLKKDLPIASPPYLQLQQKQATLAMSNMPSKSFGDNSVHSKKLEDHLLWTAHHWDTMRKGPHGRVETPDTLPVQRTRLKIIGVNGSDPPWTNGG